ncbi:MAG: hypothetical protein COA79_00700 [Planctomycetota bacterium]|nr:MAG: hypothetical protein COA79_00700 [Planctomycetota bacterium]
MRSNLKIIVLSLLFIAFYQFLWSVDCEICKNKIKAGVSFYRVKSKTYCSKKCLRKTLPKCSVCKKHSDKIYRKEGKEYCKPCIIAAAPKCSICKVTTFGKSFLKKENTIYCTEKCYLTTIAECVLCKKKELGMSKIENTHYCSKCIKLPQCNSCSLISNEQMQLDGRQICTSCLTYGIQSQNDAYKIYIEVKELLKSKFNIETTVGLPMKIVDMDEMKRIKEDNNSQERGLYHVSRLIRHKVIKQGDVIIKREKIETKATRNIYILTYLPKRDFIKVAAHELMHDWVALNYPKLKEEKICEGLSEYLSSLVNIHYGNDKLNLRMEKNKNPIYGGGYRFIKLKDKGGGIVDIKNWLQKTYNQ